MIITIDGPAGAGKSTVARLLARKLGFLYIDTGAMYRAMTLKAVNEHVDFDNIEELVCLAEKTKIDLHEGKNGKIEILLDGNDVSKQIRTPELTDAVFKIARIPQLRKIMVEIQRTYAKTNNIVMEGRDIGTVVFPKAEKKFYLDADFKERASRRVKELCEKGISTSFEEVIQQIKERDYKDKTRSCGPLKKADDAMYVDSTKLSIQQVVKELLTHIKNKSTKK